MRSGVVTEVEDTRALVKERGSDETYVITPTLRGRFGNGGLVRGGGGLLPTVGEEVVFELPIYPSRDGAFPVVRCWALTSEAQ